jgi:hypothetical protein
MTSFCVLATRRGSRLTRPPNSDLDKLRNLHTTHPFSCYSVRLYLSEASLKAFPHYMPKLRLLGPRSPSNTINSEATDPTIISTSAAGRGSSTRESASTTIKSRSDNDVSNLCSPQLLLLFLTSFDPLGNRNTCQPPTPQGVAHCHTIFIQTQGSDSLSLLHLSDTHASYRLLPVQHCLLCCPVLFMTVPALVHDLLPQRFTLKSL